MTDMRNTGILYGIPQVKRQLGRHRQRWEADGKMNLIGTECENVDLIKRA
jgi:hypothetical protein